MARIERATSPLPRECSTTEPHGHRHGFGHGPEPLFKPLPTSNLSYRYCCCLGWLPRRLERETGIEPASLAWKARVLPLNYSRLEPGTALLKLLRTLGG